MFVFRPQDSQKSWCSAATLCLCLCLSTYLLFLFPHTARYGDQDATHSRGPTLPLLRHNSPLKTLTRAFLALVGPVCLGAPATLGFSHWLRASSPFLFLTCLITYAESDERNPKSERRNSYRISALLLGSRRVLLTLRVFGLLHLLLLLLLFLFQINSSSRCCTTLLVSFRR
jgi:hypothetical protein